MRVVRAVRVHVVVGGGGNKCFSPTTRLNDDNGGVGYDGDAGRGHLFTASRIADSFLHGYRPGMRYASESPGPNPLIIKGTGCLCHGSPSPHIYRCL